MGETFPVVWERQGDSKLHWRRMGCGRLMPMLVALHRIEFAAFARGYALYGNPGVPPRMMEANGWLYKHQGKADPGAMQAWEANLPAPLARAAAQPVTYWQEEMLPPVRDALTRLQGVDLDSASLSQLQHYLQEAIALDEQVELLIQPMMVISGAKRRFLNLHRELYDEDGAGLLIVTDSIVQRMNRALAAGPEPFLLEFGDQLQSREITRPTWREEPEAILRQAQALPATAPTPAAPPAEAGAEYHAALRVAREAAFVEEEHSVWLHLRARTPLRAVLLALSRRLAEQGALEAADGIWWVTPAEVAGQAADLRTLVARRRADWDRLAEVEPPAELGRV